MSLRVRAAVAAAAFSLLGLPAHAAASYSAIFSFGDSLSDAGNLFTLSANPIYGIEHQPLSPYSEGRFSNGDVWAQDVSKRLGLGPLTPSLLGGTDYAFGGATTGTTDIHVSTLIDLPSQIGAFELSHPTGAPSDALYTMWIGANDIFGALGALASNSITFPDAVAIASEAAQNAADAVAALGAVGAEDFLILDLPDLGAIPAFSGTTLQGAAKDLATLFNSDLGDDLAKLSGLTISEVDTFAVLDDVVANPVAYGFSNASDPCWTGNFTGMGGTLCSQTLAGQNQYVFWDHVHPTSAAQEFVANAALRAIGAPVPEVSTWAMLAVGFAGLGAFAARRRGAEAAA